VNDPALALLRLRIADTDPTNQLLDDLQLQAIAGAAAGPWSAAADALDIIAVSELLVSKKIRTQSLSTDGPAVSAELRALANRYRENAIRDGESGADGLTGGEYFGVTDALPQEVWGL